MADRALSRPLHPEPAEERVELGVSGMHCAACVTRVERAIRSVPGVVEAEVGLATESARVRFSGTLDVTAVQEAVRGVGYRAEQRLSMEESLREREREREDEYRRRLRRFGWGAVLALPVLLIGHADLFPFISLSPDRMRGLWASIWVPDPPHLFYVGRGFFTGAWAALRRRAANMDTLVALGTGSAWLYSTVAVTLPSLFPAGTAHPFYEATAVVITLVVLGQALEARARGRTSRALHRLMDLRPQSAHVIRDRGEVEIPAGEVAVGDVLIVRPGEGIPVDGTVEEGRSTVDESMITARACQPRRRRVTQWSAAPSTAPVRSVSEPPVSAGHRTCAHRRDGAASPGLQTPDSEARGPGCWMVRARGHGRGRVFIRCLVLGRA